jgi:hypothetical protein
MARHLNRIALALIAVFMLPAAVQGAFFPRSFYDDFPMGRNWIAVDGPYNEHLVRDVGGLFLALIVLTVFALRKPTLVVPVATAWLVWGALHFTYHVRHLAAYDGIDEAALLFTLGFVPAAAIVALVATRGPGSDADEA